MDATYKGYQCSDGTNEYWSPRPNHDDGFRVVAQRFLKGNGSGGKSGGVSPSFCIG